MTRQQPQTMTRAQIDARLTELSATDRNAAVVLAWLKQKREASK